MISERISKLRAEMARENIAAYLVPTADFHGSEYVGEHFKCRAFLTGFTGSAGTAVVTMEDAGLWTDGRYFLQAEAQLKNTPVRLFKQDVEGVPTVEEYLRSVLRPNQRLAVDGRVISGKQGKRFAALAKDCGASFITDLDLIDRIWTDRPPMSAAPVWLLEEQYTGEGIQSKLARVRNELDKAGSDLLLMSSLCDIAWLLNLRGGDIQHVPVVLSYLMLSAERCRWYVNDVCLSQETMDYLAANGIETAPYFQFYQDCDNLSAGKRVMLDSGVMNARVCQGLDPAVKIIDCPDPTVPMKAVKNEVQMEQLRRVHRLDAVAMIRFLRWVKDNVGKTTITERSAADYLEQLRRDQPDFLDLSFTTISSYAHHGAIVHYSVTEETDIPLRPEGLFLVDSGGHYLGGTTDITRTIALGQLTEEERVNYTRVLQGNLHLANIRFLYGCSGMTLDILARAPLWQQGLDFKHGTGHGIGDLLSVHEGPNSIRWRQTPGRSEGSVLEEGMVTSDEPGYYAAGKYGIRLENEILCRKDVKNEYGQFMRFEVLTYVPFDLEAVEVSMLTTEERDWLNEYHALVYDTMSPLLEPEERDWLKTATRAV